jgi:hypothetical protein
MGSPCAGKPAKSTRGYCATIALRYLDPAGDGRTAQVVFGTDQGQRS